MVNEAGSLLEWLKSVDVTQLAVAIILLLTAWASTVGLARLASFFTQLFPSQRLTILRLETIVRFFVYIGVALGTAVALLSPKPQLLLTLLGSAAVAIGFALKDIAASMVAGLIIIFDKPFQVGDRVTFQGNYGDIVAIGLRSVRLLTLGHDTLTIPNSVFLTEVVASGNSGSLSMMVTTTTHVAVGADIELAVRLLREVVVTSRFAWLKNGVSVTVDEVVGETLVPCLKLTARCYICDVRHEKAYVTDVIIRSNQAFARAGIARFEKEQCR
jgi:small-conductance mechanosensitive channel